MCYVGKFGGHFLLNIHLETKKEMVKYQLHEIIFIFGHYPSLSFYYYYYLKTTFQRLNSVSVHEYM
jgi:hypothetical protein